MARFLGGLFIAKKAHVPDYSSQPNQKHFKISKDNNLNAMLFPLLVICQVKNITNVNVL